MAFPIPGVVGLQNPSYSPIVRVERDCVHRAILGSCSLFLRYLLVNS